jgi:hypothetical protein
VTESAAPNSVVLLHVQEIVYSHGKKGIHDRWGTVSMNGDRSYTSHPNIKKQNFTSSKKLFLYTLLRKGYLNSQLSSV